MKYFQTLLYATLFVCSVLNTITSLTNENSSLNQNSTTDTLISVHVVSKIVKILRQKIRIFFEKIVFHLEDIPPRWPQCGNDVPQWSISKWVALAGGIWPTYQGLIVWWKLCSYFQKFVNYSTFTEGKAKSISPWRVLTSTLQRIVG